MIYRVRNSSLVCDLTLHTSAMITISWTTACGSAHIGGDFLVSLLAAPYVLEYRTFASKALSMRSVGDRGRGTVPTPTPTPDQMVQPAQLAGWIVDSRPPKNKE